MQLRIGCSGWYYPEWQGVFYPADLKKSQWFKYYTRQFDTVELNSPFYHFPQAKTAHNWYRQAPTGFTYSLKVNRAITHLQRFKEVKDLIRQFYECGKILEEKMGCFLFQLPPSFHYTEEHLDRLLIHLDPLFRNVIEFRHKSWWCSQVIHALTSRDIIFCAISYKDLPQELVQTSPDIYMRFHGVENIYADDYSSQDLEHFVKNIQKTQASTAWVYFNNTAKSRAPFNALTLKQMTKAITEVL